MIEKQRMHFGHFALTRAKRALGHHAAISRRVIDGPAPVFKWPVWIVGHGTDLERVSPKEGARSSGCERAEEVRSSAPRAVGFRRTSRRPDRADPRHPGTRRRWHARPHRNWSR